jgi:hypothetical protein
MMRSIYLDTPYACYAVEVNVIGMNEFKWSASMFQDLRMRRDFHLALLTAAQTER